MAEKIAAERKNFPAAEGRRAFAFREHFSRIAAAARRDDEPPAATLTLSDKNERALQRSAFLIFVRAADIGFYIFRRAATFFGDGSRRVLQGSFKVRLIVINGIDYRREVG